MRNRLGSLHTSVDIVEKSLPNRTKRSEANAVNLILLEERDRTAHGDFLLRDHRAKHICEVLASVVGSHVRVGLLDGPLGTGEVMRVDKDAVELRCAFDPSPPPKPLVDVLLAIPRPKSLRKLLPEVVALGVDRIVLMRTWRVAKPYITADIVQPEAHRPLLLEGLMQARRTHAPRVSFEPLFKPFLEDRLPAIVRGAAQCIVAHPQAAVPMSSLRIPREGRVVIAIGPEGGFIPYEVEAFEAAGFTPVSMGPFPLRVETACVALMAQIELLRQLGCGAPDVGEEVPR